MTQNKKKDNSIVKKSVRRQQTPVKRPSVMKHRRNRLFSIGENMYMNIRRLNKKPCVNIRNYNRDEHGRLCATKRDLLLSSNEWEQLKNVIAVIDGELQQRQAKKQPQPV